MPPATRSAEREEERRLNTRTLTIASVASATAAAVTSQLWIAGTWIAAALTPVLVALISEAMHRPTERIARAWTSDREAGSSGRPRARSATRHEPAAVTGSAGPVRVYRQTSRGATRSERGRPVLSGRRIPVRAVLITGAIAFAIALTAITTIDLVSGGSVGRGSGGTTFWGGGKSSGSATNDGTEEKSQPEQPAPNDRQPAGQDETAPDQQPPSETTPQTPPSDTAPVTPPAETTPTTP